VSDGNLISKQAHQESNVAGKRGTEPPIALPYTKLYHAILVFVANRTWLQDIFTKLSIQAALVAAAFRRNDCSPHS
jgi:hypothetical protein